MVQFVLFEQIAVAESYVALQAPVRTGTRNRGRGRRRLRGWWPDPAPAVQMFFHQVVLLLLLLLLLMVLVVFDETL